MVARASGKIFTARRCCHPHQWHFQTGHPPPLACGCTLSATGGSGSLSLSLSPVGMRARRHSVDQPHVDVRLAGLSAGQPRQRENFHRTQVLKPTEMAFPHSPPTRHCTQMHPLSLQLAVALLPPSLPLSPRGNGRAAFSRSAPRRGAARRAALRPPAVRRAASP